MSNYEHIIEAITDQPWAIMPAKMEAICEVIEKRVEGIKAQSALTSERLEKVAVVDGVAVIPVEGVMAKRMNVFMEFSGGVSTELLQKDIQAALDEDQIRAIVLRIDSPGGQVDGSFTLADVVRSGRDRKPIIAFADGLSASASYLLASASTQIVANETAQVGSIGVIATRLDRTKASEKAGLVRHVFTGGSMKAATSPDVPLNDAFAAEIQRTVDAFYGMFIDKVAAGRDVSRETVAEKMAEGRIFVAGQALALGMIDKIGELGDAIDLAREVANKSQLQRSNNMGFKEDMALALDNRADEIGDSDRKEIAVAAIAQVRDHDKQDGGQEPAREGEPNRATTGHPGAKATIEDDTMAVETVSMDTDAVMLACEKAGIGLGEARKIISANETTEDALTGVVERMAKTQKAVAAAEDHDEDPTASNDRKQHERVVAIQGNNAGMSYADALKQASREEAR